MAAIRKVGKYGKADEIVVEEVEEEEDDDDNEEEEEEEVIEENKALTDLLKREPGFAKSGTKKNLITPVSV
ncbi:hypothetical protein HZH68_007234 [Vespula germanica]|uniref:Uncharacterized protein n=1 Tax=Vespula germanica TaxID=30212 RepID=A0A834KAN4_VESGE|nr:hypothetical protein HZH68_007234 [Vespula germanica]